MAKLLASKKLRYSTVMLMEHDTGILDRGERRPAEFPFFICHHPSRRTVAQFKRKADAARVFKLIVDGEMSVC